MTDEVKPELEIYPWQWRIVEDMFPETNEIRFWLESNFDVKIMDGPTIRDVQAKIMADLTAAETVHRSFYHEQSKGYGKTWLGSQNEQERNRVRFTRVEEDLSVPGIRGVGYRADQILFDEPFDPPARYHGFSYGGESPESDSALEEWLQRRSICFRASSCSVA